MGFQTKIFLWMMGALVAILVPTLLLVQAKLQEKAEERIAQQFENQVQLVLSERVQRLEKVTGAATELAQTSAVKRSLAGELSEDEKIEFAMDALSERAEADGPRGTGRRTGNRDPSGKIAPGQFSRLLPVLCTVDLDGTIVELTPRRSGELSVRRRMQLRHEVTHEHLTDLSGIAVQQVGYVLSDRDGRGERLREVVATPVRDGDEVVGVFLMGIDAETELDHLISRLEQVSDREAGTTGFFTEGKVVQVKGLRGVDREHLGELVAAEIHDGEGMAEIELDDRPFRLAWQEMNPGSILPSAYQIAFFPLSSVRADIRNLQMKLLIGGGVAVAVAVLASFFISRSLARPVKILEEATRRIGDGDYSARIKITSRDELGRLGASFNEMAEGLTLKERYREVLSKVSDETVAQSLIDGSLELGGETRFLTVLFCDIREFTSLTELINPQEVVSFLNSHMTAMTEVVYAHMGVVDKFIGDEIMAVFGAPKEYGDDPKNAVSCALAMVAKRAELNEQATHRFDIGVGVASGEMVAGCMGSIDRLNYTVVGEPVNLAARLCGRAGPGEVLAAVSEEIAQGEIISLEARGFRGRVKAIRVSGIVEARESRPITG